MRTAAATTTGTHLYSDLLEGCKHSRLKAALSGHLPAPTRPSYVATPAPVAASDASKAYFWVLCMSVLSLLSVVVTGTIAA